MYPPQALGPNPSTTDADTIDLDHVRLKTGRGRRRNTVIVGDIQDEALAALKHNFCYYGLQPTALSVPRPLSHRTFENSNFLTVYAALQRRLATLGKIPTLYVLNAVRELVKNYDTMIKMSSEWLVS